MKNWLLRWFRRNGNHATLRALSDATGIQYVTLKKAAQDGRLEARKSGHIWLSTPAAVERAVAAGRLRRKE